MDQNLVRKLVDEAIEENETLFLIELSFLPNNKIKVIVDGDTGIGLFNGGGASQFGIQAIGVLAYGVWATLSALVGFGILKSTIGLRVSEEVEIKGLDEAEHGIGGFEGGGFEAWIKDNTK